MRRHQKENVRNLIKLSEKNQFKVVFSKREELEGVQSF